MDSLFAIKGKGFVIVAADTYSLYSIIRLKDTDDKITEIDGNKLLALSGSIADCKQFGDFVTRNMALQRIRHGIPLSTRAAASFTRNELANALRRRPYQVDLLLAGLDKSNQVKSEPKLFWIDNLASMVELEKAAQGYAAHFLLGLLDRFCEPNMSEDAALEVVKKCINELATRFLIGQNKFVVKILRSLLLIQFIKRYSEDEGDVEL